jgi:ElaB/YqjD/DUF883 family membrane-anchored ribosome-binding protein
MPDPVGLDALAATLNFIPIIGPTVMIFLLLIVGVVTAPTVGAGVLATLGFVLVVSVEGQFITPAIVGRRLSLNGLAVILSLAFRAWLWGPMGAFLSPPPLIVGLILKERLSGLAGRGNISSGQAFRVIPYFVPETVMSDAAPQVSPVDAGDKAAYDRLEKDVTAVKNDVSNLSQQISDAVNTLAGLAQKQAKRGYKNARANVDAVVSDASERAGVFAGAAQDAAASIGETLEDAIQERPLAIVAFALGLGFLIGVTWRR